MVFVLKHRIVRDLLRACPGIQFPQAEQKRNKEEGQPGDRPRAGLEKAPNRKTPTTAREVVQHEHLKTSQRQTEPKKITEKVRGKEFALTKRKAAETSA